MTITPIRILIVDDHDVVRLGLMTFLKTSEEIDVVGQAANGAEAIQLCDDLQPDVVLMDIMMPIMNGIEATRQLHEMYPTIKVIALSSLKEDKPIREMLAAGAVGYLLKDAPIIEYLQAIKTVYGGNTVFSAEVLPILMQPPGSKNTYDLSGRELEVLKLMVAGLGNREIAAHLVISLSTVKFHVAGIIEKLGVHNRVDAVALAVEKHLIS